MDYHLQGFGFLKPVFLGVPTFYGIASVGRVREEGCRWPKKGVRICCEWSPLATQNRPNGFSHPFPESLCYRGLFLSCLCLCCEVFAGPQVPPQQEGVNGN